MPDAIPTLCSPLSCSRFANTSEDTDIRMFGWLFDRRVAPRSLASSDEQFRREYVAMTGLIWPQTWISREDLPPVDAALEPCVQELLTTVSAIKSKNENAVKLWHPDEFPVDLRILEESFSAIFQASRRSREKKDNGDQCEVSWRHDLDRLLFDFFIRLVESDSGTLSGGATSIADLEDPRVRPTLETTLRFPKSDVLRPIPNGFEQSMEPLLYSDRRATEQLLESRGSAVEEKRRVSNTELARYAYVTSQFSHWVNQRQDEKESVTIINLGRFPKDGKCDALGRLRVRLSGVSGKHLGQFPLVRTHPSDEAGASDAAKPGGSKRDDSVHSKPRRYTISTAASPFLRTDVATTAAVDTITSQLQHLKIEEQDSLLDLPLVAVEYKKKSGNMAQATNQLRMYLTASVKFLEAVRITDFPVYGVEADGSVVSLPVAVLRSDDSGNIVHLFERLVEKLDISSPLGAWHYATILCRLAKLHAEVLETRFETVKEPLTTALRSGSTRMEQWTITHQLATLVAENKVKFSEPQKKGGKK
ncbi:hypothetical protein F5J12DRAFT_578617 [Pisolithus orientalis]|uniref:uncharacterized protein n=1 Tax=Pisolithus orientalis TaxID=936130 RepID=UPI0022249493|nr:uncharacterized protein F5J12DRAFT_578617 [Pisolithus orientalis]KAI5986082.1 hypothetical protein F5J12DRAFT_578617 [Pisolithus orientalis]